MIRQILVLLVLGTALAGCARGQRNDPDLICAASILNQGALTVQAGRGGPEFVASVGNAFRMYATMYSRTAKISVDEAMEAAKTRALQMHEHTGQGEILKNAENCLKKLE